MEIEIRTGEDGRSALFAYSKTCLFQFEHRKNENSWYFWMPGHPYDPMVFKGRFPLGYFKDACRANFFIDHGFGIDEDVVVVKGRNYIGLK